MVETTSVSVALGHIKKVIPAMFAELTELRKLIKALEAREPVAAAAAGGEEPKAKKAAPKSAKAADGPRKFIRYPYRKYLLELLENDGEIIGVKARSLFPDASEDADWNEVEGLTWVKLSDETKNKIKVEYAATDAGKKNAEEKSKKASKSKGTKASKGDSKDDSKEKKPKAKGKDAKGKKAVIEEESEEEEEED
jgi:hypothetical protein